MQLSEAQRVRYEELKKVYEEKAGSVLQANETAKRARETLDSDVKQKTDLIANHQQELDSTRKLVQELRGQLDRLNNSKNDCEQVVRHLEEESAGLQNEYSSLSEELKQKRESCERLKQKLQNSLDAQEGKNRKAERKACVKRLQDLFPEVKGLLVDLVNATQRRWVSEVRVRSRYRLAVTTALGSHLDAVVVSTKVAAIECIQWSLVIMVTRRFLKEQHMPAMDFYPLDALVPKDIRVDLRRQQYTLCYDVLEFDPSVEVAVRYAVGNTVVADNLTTARTLAYRERIRERIVTLDGEEISKSGAISGGVGTTTRVDAFEEKEVEKKREELEACEKECQEMEKRLQRVARNGDRVRNVENEIVVQRGKLR